MLHELTTWLVLMFDLICIEHLNVKAMARGWHARSIHDAAFGEFCRQLLYKAAWYGKTVIAADRYFPSTKRCSGCGHVVDEMRLDVREWTCPKCRCHHDRDINAANNLLAEGMRQLAGGDIRPFLRADAGSACPGAVSAQVPAGEARSEQVTGACLEHARVT
jgi:putative transposase